jgi:hypothetical protein
MRCKTPSELRKTKKETTPVNHTSVNVVQEADLFTSSGLAVVKPAG